MSSSAEGRLFLDKNSGYWILDAEPHVMEMFSRLFPVASLCHDPTACQYTHRPRSMPNGLDAKRNLDWFLSRYELSVTAEDVEEIKSGSKEYDRIQKEKVESFYNYTPPDLKLALPLREYQLQACSLFMKRKSLLLADQVGLGKTPTAVGATSTALPVLVVVPPHLVKQWEGEILKFLPSAKVHSIYGKKHYPLPEADFYVTAYSRVSAWADFFGPKKINIKSLVLDEVHDLRNDSTQKYEAVASIARSVEYKLGLSATPIMNYGSDIYSIFNILDPGRLGNKETFRREWCTWSGIRDPKLFGNFLRKNLMMIRRTREDVALQLDSVNRIVYTVDADLESLHALEKEAKQLAIDVLTGDFKTAGMAARQLDWRLRHATGVAKARAVSEVVKMLLESGEKVVLFGWHRDVYEVWKKELHAYNPVFYTGEETIKVKNESLECFTNGDSKVFIISLRSGAGINGLQNVASYAVFGELDWSPGVIEQCIGRLWRDGQKNQVTAMFVTITDGADPVMIKAIGLKTSEARQIINPQAKNIGTVYSDEQRVKELAREYLKTKGIEPPKRTKKIEEGGEESFLDVEESNDSDGEIGDGSKNFVGGLFVPEPTPGSTVQRILLGLKQRALSSNTEVFLQDEVEDVLKCLSISYKKEKKIDKDSRLDFLVDDSIVIECKVSGANKRAMLRQLKRYKAKLKNVSAFVIVTPWSLKHFDLDGVPVYCVDTSVSALLIDGLS